MYNLKVEDINWDDINVHQDIISLPDEVWITMVDLHEGSFEVSNYGRCRRKPYMSYHGQKDYYVIKITDNGNGYKKFAMTYKNILKNLYVHRAVATHFLDNFDNLPQVNHKRTGLGKHDNRAEHLEWVTNSDNILDAHQMDYRTKVKTSIDIKSDEFVDRMYRRYKDTGMVGQTAREFGVPRTSLSSIVNKRSRRLIIDAVDKEYSNKIT